MTENYKENLLPSLIAGTINGIIFIVSAMSLAALIFTGPLAAYLPQGIGIMLVGSVIFALFSTFTATYPLILIAPQDIPIAILALMAMSISSGIGDQLSPDQVYKFIFVAIGVTSILVGIFFWILGRFRLGKLVRFIPFPVVGGFMAGTGWLIVKFSFAMMTDMDLTLSNALTFLNGNVLIQWVPGLIFAVVLLVANRRISHYLLMPGILTGSILLFYGITFSQGFAFSDLESAGYLLGPFPEGGLFPGTPLPYVSDFRWDLFMKHFPAIATMMVLNAISVLFNYSGLELIIKEDFDLDKELRLTGYGNILAGFAGTPPGYITLSETSMAYNIGARTRLSNIIVALLCGITLIFGAKVISVFPKVILGGLLLNLGLDFLVEWLVDTWKRLQKMDYLVIVLILVVIATVGFLEGIVIGLLMSIALFVIKYSKVEVIKYELSGKTYSSNVGRSDQMKKILEENGDKIFILPLQGFVFFGTANQILERVQKRFESDPIIDMSFLVFDFRQVTGVDSSAVNSFNKLQIMAEKNEFRVLLCGMTDEVNDQFETENLISEDSDIFNAFGDLDHGLEWCEESIIKKSISLNENEDHPISVESFKDKFQQVADFFEYREELEGTRIIEQGEDPGGIYFIDSGKISVWLNTGDGSEIRLKTMGVGTVVGEVSLYLGSLASASVVTDEPCQIYYLSKKKFNELNQDAPHKASELHTYVVKLLSDRLAESNATIRALMR